MGFNLLSPKVQDLIKEKGFLQPTAAQELSIKPILNGYNTLVIAPTGVGKTEACFFPILHKLAQEEHKPISVLYITPLKSLNRDLLNRMYWWGDKLNIEITVRHGDTPQKERAAQSEMPSHIFIVTPETLGAILTGKRMKEHLKNVKYVVVDEIHELVESKRGIQMSLLLERLRELSGNFQRIGLSATVGSPKKVADFLGPNVKVIRAELEKKYTINIEAPKPSRKDRVMSDDLFIGPETTARLRRLYELIMSHKSVLAFTNTRETAEVLSSRLRSLDRELKQTVHHGSLARDKRIESEQEFKAQALKSIIATSSLELGIDIGSIDLVIQYLSPRQATRLIQRVGRSGHKVGQVSKGVLISGDEDLFESTVIANRAMHSQLEEVKIHDMALDVLASQITGIAFDKGDVSLEDVHKIVKRSSPYAEIKKKEVDEIIRFLEGLRILWINPTQTGYTIRKRRKAFDYYFGNLSTIPTKKQYRVISIIENEPIGFLDEEFVAEHGQSGEKFVVSGRAWRIIQVEDQKVTVEPVEDIESAVPAWEGELIPVPFAVAQGVGKLRKSIIKMNEKDAMEEYNIDIQAVREMRTLMQKQSKHMIPDDKHVLIETHKDFIIVHACFGSLVNDTIGRYIAAQLTEETGVSVNVKVDPYRIIFQTIVKPEKIRELLTNGGDIQEVLTRAIERSTLFKYRFIHVARRFGIIERNADYGRINMGKIIAHYFGTPCYKETLREIFLDKMDMKKSGDLMKRLSKNEIKIKIIPGLSPLGELGIMHKFGDILKPRVPEKEIFNAFKRRLLLTRMRLVCVNCGDYSLVRTVRDIEQQPECPKCMSRMIGVIRKSNTNAVNIVKKKLKKKDLNDEEMQDFLNTRRSADLVIVYGKKASIAMAGHGIGPQTAARLLAMQYPRDKFFSSILSAEKDFARTKKYWK